MSGKFKGYKRPNWSSFHGRAGRREWLRITLQASVVSAMLSALTPTLALVYEIPFVLILLATTTRRLHDLKLSGWIQAIPMAMLAGAMAALYVIQRLGLADFSRLFGESRFAFPSASAFGDMFKSGGFGKLDTLTLNQLLPLAALAAASLAYIALYGVLLFAPGNRGPNCYGEGD